MRTPGVCIVVALIASGCGRIGFGPAPGGDAASGDAATDDAGSCARACEPTPPQSGCCPGDSCQLVDFEPLCVTPGTRRRDESCDDVDRCEATLTCDRPYLTDPRGTCGRLCDDDGDCDPGTLCAAIGNDTGGVVAEAGQCSSTCTDPLTGAGCGVGRTCRVIRLLDRGGTLRYATTCDLLGGVAAGGTCTGSLDCVAGRVCSGSVCRQTCRIGGTDCAIGTCQSLNPAAIVRGVTYGLCV